MRISARASNFIGALLYVASTVLFSVTIANDLPQVALFHGLQEWTSRYSPYVGSAGIWLLFTGCSGGLGLGIRTLFYLARGRDEDLKRGDLVALAIIAIFTFVGFAMLVWYLMGYTRVAGP